jgi:2-polyprenyl-3-methyl-5-hydroxy-6-metoxy-1,4-benzoquinol methylase
MTRNYQQEAIDSTERLYEYDFDKILRGYMMQSFEPLLPRGKALEMGCYKGEFTEILAKTYSDLTVIEAAENLIEETRARVGGGVKFVHSTFENAVSDAPYDAIFLMHTLEHLDNPVAVLKKVNKWLSEKGLLFLVVPNAHAASRQIAVKMGLISHPAAVTKGEFEHGHRITYNFDSLERDACAAGLSIKHRGGVFFKPFANFQFDKLLHTDIIDKAYLDGCYELGKEYPDLCASIYLVCGKGSL